MVVFKEGNDIFGVVDGQQRLTTITMILAALRNRFEQENLLDLAKGIHRLIERADINNKDLFILQTETSYPYLQEYIQKFGHPEIQPKIHEEEEVLKKSFQFITEKVNKLLEDLKPSLFVNEEERKENIKISLSYARDRILGLKLIFVEVDNEDDAYMIFETLNTRGKDLGVSDLVKNHITRLLRPRNAGVDLVKDKWKDIRQTIEGSQSDIGLDEFLHHFWLSRYDYVTAKNLFKDLKDVIGKDEKKANSFLENLLYDSKIYREINEPLSRKWAIEETGIRDSLIALNLFRVRQPSPMILSIMREYAKGTLKKRQVEDILRRIENFHFMFTAVTSQRSSGGISFMYASSAKQLLNAKTLSEKVDILQQLKDKLKSKLPKYAEFEANFTEIGYSDTVTKQKKRVQYILKKFDDFNSQGLAVNYDKMTIEHIAPQNSKNSSLVSPSAVSQLGNLILVDDALNAKLSNKDFSQKKTLLKDLRIWLDNYIKNAKTWTDAEIEARTKGLADVAFKKVWAL